MTQFIPTAEAIRLLKNGKSILLTDDKKHGKRTPVKMPLNGDPKQFLKDALADFKRQHEMTPWLKAKVS